MVCLSRRIQYRQQSEGSFMPDTNLQNSEATVIPTETSVIPSNTPVILSEAKDLSSSETPTNAILDEPNVIPSEAKDLTSLEAPSNVIPSDTPVILSVAKDLTSTEAPKDEDTLELDLTLEEELIIEDFTIDGICGVY